MDLHYDVISDIYASSSTTHKELINKIIYSNTKSINYLDPNRKCIKCGCHLSKYNTMDICRNCVEKSTFAVVEEYPKIDLKIYKGYY